MEEPQKRIVELENLVSELENNLIHDPLTGLKTRAFLEEEVGVYLNIILQQDQLKERDGLQRKERFGFRNLSVIFFDIDHFKLVNDTYGHDAGDIVLKKIASAIRSSLRTGDTLARWGGEEMVASLLGANEKDATAKAEEIRLMIEKLPFPEVLGLSVTISAGVATSEKGADLASLIKSADQALYAAKNSGRNQVVPYSMLPNGDSK